MTYGAISNWKSNVPNTDDMKATAKAKYVKAVMALGADDCYFIETGSDTFSVCTIYPDEATATTAMAKQNAVRADASSEMPVKLLGEARGTVFASS
ncbi:hypothetical protein [Aquibium sp. ELW1220]|uniref:hypothetical protein n=1 Tax=Aquibium sp. ELW1220 TaxID=2976766 RepID=UPI0025AFEFA8|nr:hypothetical protein [Aquibium sp. ELW1220]MDN2583195.1 hypothetical protein [Aquibium sp. ELW1220]